MKCENCPSVRAKGNMHKGSSLQLDEEKKETFKENIFQIKKKTSFIIFALITNVGEEANLFKWFR